jgi:hypothetical protein
MAGADHYRGLREPDGTTHVWVVRDGVETPLEHRVKHSPDGFEWGYGGSGPSDLARSMLWDYLGKEPSKTMYQAFKAAAIERIRSSEWVIGMALVERWAREYYEAGFR